jgi:AraC family transcriptional activator of tynA and feaB
VHIHSFSTDLTPVRQRPELFRREMQDRFSVALSVQDSRDAPLETNVRAYCGRHLRFAELRFSPHRTSSVSDGRSGSRILFTLQLEGEAQFSQGGRNCCVPPGSFCLIDPALPFNIETTQMHARSVYLDRQSLFAVAPYIQTMTGRCIDGKSGVGAIMRATVDEMFKLAPSLDEDTAESISEALPYTLATALTALGKDPELAHARLHLFHKKRILRFVRQSLHDPTLDPRRIANGVNLSLRYLYDLFADEDMPLMKWIWSERLQRAQRDLRAPHLLARSIAEIAYSWGFSNQAHFSRAFRLEFGISPRQWRQPSHPAKRVPDLRPGAREAR